MKNLLETINKDVIIHSGVLDAVESKKYREKYKNLIKQAEIECPEPQRHPTKKGKRGRIKKSKSRNLLERLKDYEDDVLWFMENEHLPFTNSGNQPDYGK